MLGHTVTTHEFDAGTDVAAIGIWDSKYCNDKYREKKFKEYYANLPQHAKDRWVFYVNTGSDGGYPTRVIIDSEFNLNPSDYKKWPGIWGLCVESGKVTVGGLEDFLSSKRQITDEKTDVEINPGEYSVEFYERTFKEGEDDYADYTSLSEKEKSILKWHGRFVPIGCIWLVLSALSLFLNWMIGLGLLLCVFTYFYVLDKIFTRLGLVEINKKIKKDESDNPVFVFVLKSTDLQIEGGHVELH